MVLQAFVDDSRSHKEDPIFALAGFVSSAEAWARFADEWQTILDYPPRLEYFKANEADSRVEQFKGWTSEQVTKRIIELVQAIRAHAAIRIHCTMFLSDFAALGRDTTFRKFFPELHEPYFFCFYDLTHAVLATMKRARVDVPVHFIFDEQGELGNKTRRWYPIFKYVLPEYEPWIGSEPRMGNDKVDLPLQAADLYAFYIRRHVRWNRKLIVPPESPLQSLWGMPDISRELTRDRLERRQRRVQEKGVPEHVRALTDAVMDEIKNR